MFKNMGGNIPGGNCPGGNFPGGSLMGGNFLGGSFLDTDPNPSFSWELFKFQSQWKKGNRLNLNFLVHCHAKY